MVSHRDTSLDSGRRPQAVAGEPDASVTESLAASRSRLCTDLVAAREARGMTIAKIAEVTRIPARSLEHLEAGEFERLPADVFVRGFLRSYARCVGLDVEQTIRRYAECGMTPAPVASPMAEELAASLATLDSTAPPVYRAGPLTQSSRDSKAESSQRSPSGGGGGDGVAGAASKTRGEPDGTGSDSAGPNSGEPDAGDRDAGDRAAASPSPNRKTRSGRKRKRKKRKRKARAPALQATEQTTEQAIVPAEVSEPVESLPPPSLVIDDDCPEAAAIVQDERDRESREDPAWRNFLPDALRDDETGSNRGALTLAVIILVIVATLTMSYLLRRPSSGGDGVTGIDIDQQQPQVAAQVNLATTEHS